MWNEHLFMTREEIREYDRIAISEMGIPSPVLMENAGRGAARLAMHLLRKRRRAAVVAGPGNNGGDGFVIARHLLNSGIAATTYLAVSPERVRGDAKVNLDILHKMGALMVDISEASLLADLPDRLRAEGFVIDALLGTGVTRAVEGHLALIIDIINTLNGEVLAVDMPSGLDADTGRPWGRAVKAAATATFGHLKRGLVLQPGAALAGAITVVPIGVPGTVSLQAGYDGEVICEARVRALLPTRELSAHKGTYGHLLVVGGLPGKSGAAALTGRAALRVGTGLVTIATTADAQPTLEAKCLEAMVDHFALSADAPMDDRTEAHLHRLINGKRAIALGPGLGTTPAMAAMAVRLLHAIKVPAVVDADGLNILAETSTAGIEIPMVLTPHPGEMARLMKRSVAEVQTDRIGASRQMAATHRAVLVLKGAGTVVAAPDGRVFINPTGNPGMATGGMGDVLTGIIGGLLAQGLDPLSAALLGVFLHGRAGDRAARKKGEPGLIASDVIDEIPGILKSWAI